MTTTTYPCNNRPRPSANHPILVQDGWLIQPLGVQDHTRIPKMVYIPFVMTTDCKYDLAATDTRCANCAHATPKP